MTSYAQSFPRLYVAASLKRRAPVDGFRIGTGFPRLYVAASLKHRADEDVRALGQTVFRGFMSRPH